MKYSLATFTLVSAGALVLACGETAEEPPPISSPPGGGAGGDMIGAGGTAPMGGAAPMGGGGGAAPMGGGGGAAPMGGNGGAAPMGGNGGAPMGGDGGAPPMAGTGGDMPGGMGGDGGSGGEMPPALTLADLVGKLDGHLLQTPCGDTPSTDDCSGGGWKSNAVQGDTQCQGGALEADIEFPIGGEPGVVYETNMHFYGVMEPREYGNVATRAQQQRPDQEPGGNISFAWMEAGAGNYLSAGDNNYNTYEMHVFDQNGQETMIYFFNADTGTGHYTFAISYEQPIQLIGGGKVQLRVFDANCRQIKNCGPGGWPCADKARRVDIQAADPQPQGLEQPGLGLDPAHSGQWWLIDVLDFTPMP